MMTESDEIEKRLIQLFGFTPDGGINCKMQLKVFEFMDWYDARNRGTQVTADEINKLFREYAVKRLKKKQQALRESEFKEVVKWVLSRGLKEEPLIDLSKLSDDERMELFSKYCCGDKDPTCQCWNDE